MDGPYWMIEKHAPLTAALRASLAEQYGWTNVPAHSHVALVAIRIHSLRGNECVQTFPFTFTASDYVGNTAGFKDAVEAVCKTRVATYRNSEPLSSLLGKWHWL